MRSWCPTATPGNRLLAALDEPQDRWPIVEALLPTLGAKEQAVLEQFYWYGLPWPLVAERQGIAVRTAQRHHRQALDKLRKRIPVLASAAV